MNVIRLSQSLKAWGTPEFETVFKREIRDLDAGQLPLQQGLTTGNYLLDNKFEAMVIHAAEEVGRLRVKAGIFYSSIIGGCACTDDPTPVNKEPEYCVVQLDIDKRTAATTVVLLNE